MQQIVNEIKTELKTTEPTLEVVFEKNGCNSANAFNCSVLLVRAMYSIIMAFIE
jgi:dipeptidase D